MQAKATAIREDLRYTRSYRGLTKDLVLVSPSGRIYLMDNFLT